MSTVGKVLIGLMILPALGWMFLAAKIADWNRGWGKVQQQTQRNIETNREQADQAQLAIGKLKLDIETVLRQKDDQVNVLRSLMSALYRSEGSVKETIDRYSLQYASMQQGVEAATRRVEVSTQELAKTNQELAAARAELAQLKDANTRSREQLARLRQTFEMTLAQNRELVERATAAATASPEASGRPSRIAR